MSIRYGPLPNLQGINGAVPIAITVNDEVVVTAPLTAKQLQKFMDQFPDPGKSYNAATIEKFTSRKYILKKADKYHPIPLQKYLREFQKRNDKTLIVEPTLLTNCLEGKIRASIDDLIINAQNSALLENKYFLCRTIRPPYIETEEVKHIATGLSGNIHLAVEDPKGEKTIKINLLKYPRRKLDDIIEEFPVGIVLAVINPKLMHEYMGSGITLIYADDCYEEQMQKNRKIQHLIVPSEEMIQKQYPNGIKWNSAVPVEFQSLVLDLQYTYQITTTDGWKKLGNLHFARKHFEEALIAYEKGLALDPDNIDLLSNRAAVYLKCNKFDEALDEAEKVLKKNPKHMKAAFRKAKSLAGLKRFKDCADFIENQMKIQPEVESSGVFIDLLCTVIHCQDISK